MVPHHICTMMDPKDREILNKYSRELSVNCNFDNISTYLKYKNIFTEEDLKMYQNAKKSEEEKCQKLFIHIQTKGLTSFNDLLQCFKDTKHSIQYEILSRNRVIIPSNNQWIPVTNHGPSQTVYKMTSDPRGYYIFINNIEFRNLPERLGANRDEVLTDVLRDMGYRGTYHVNQSKERMRYLLKEFAAREDLSTVDSLIVLISSHGGVSSSKEWKICSSDSNVEESDPILVDEIVSLFDNCKLPQGQPKIFCISACRSGPDKKCVEMVHKKKKCWDTFILAPCFEGLLSNRFDGMGTWMFIALGEVLKEHAHDKDLDHMKNLINDKFEEFHKFAKNRKSFKEQSLSFYKFGVSKRLFFNPPVLQREEDGEVASVCDSKPESD